VPDEGGNLLVRGLALDMNFILKIIPRLALGAELGRGFHRHTADHEGLAVGFPIKIIAKTSGQGQA
jgi:hypothetical protein